MTALQGAVVAPVISDALKAGREWLGQAAYVAPWRSNAKPIADVSANVAVSTPV